MPREFVYKNNRPAGWTNEFIRQNSPKMVEQEKAAWSHIHENDEALTGLTRDGRWNADFKPEGQG